MEENNMEENKTTWVFIYDTEDCINESDAFIGTYSEMLEELNEYKASPYTWNITVHEIYHEE